MNPTLPRNRADKLRWILFALLVPLLAFAIVEAARYDDKPVMRLALSRNGKQLYVFRCSFDYRAYPSREIYEDVQTWDIATQRLISTKKTESNPIYPGAGGECYLQLTSDRRGLRILEPGSFEVRREV